MSLLRGGSFTPSDASARAAGIDASMPGLQSRHRLARGCTVGVTAALLQACGGGGGGDAGPPPLTLPTGRVSAASPVAAGCTGGSASGSFYANAEVEPMLARQPANGEQWVAVWQQDRWSNGGARAIVSALTTDGGRSWQRTLHPFSRCGGAASGSAGDFERSTDPWVDIGSDGVVHVMAMGFSGQSFTAGGASAMLASRSTDGGRTYSTPQRLVADVGATYFNDKNTLTVDMLNPRYVYALWDRLDAAGNGPTLMARSTDAGASWEPAREIYRPIAPAGGVAQTIGNRIVVLPGGPDAGAVINVFTQIDSASSTLNRVRVVRSDDHGQTWGAPVTVAEHRGVGTTDAASGLAVRDGSIIPAIAVTSGGTLWVAWQDSRFSGGMGVGLHDAIAVSRSSDGGRSWSAPVAANGSLAVGAFTPTLAARADGRVGLVYFDLRPETSSAATLLGAAWLATTLDGATWAETSVWPVFDLTQAPNARGLFLGDYMGLVSTGVEFVPLLVLSSTDTDNRTDVYTLRITPGMAAATSAGRAQALAAAGTVAETEFQARRQAFTRAVMERRVADWGRRVGLDKSPQP